MRNFRGEARAQKLASKRIWNADAGALNVERGLISRWFPEVDDLRSKTNTEVLDIGCGLGIHLMDFSGQNIGLDISIRNLTQAQQINSEGMFVLADAEALPFKEATFDVVMLIQTLHHLPSYRRTFEEVHRVLKPQGLLLVEDENADANLIIYPVVRITMLTSHLAGHYAEGLGMPLVRGLKTLVELGFSIQSIQAKGSSLKGFWFSSLRGRKVHPSLKFARKTDALDKIILAVDHILRKLLPPGS